MNLSMDALRWVTVKALRGRTWAGLAVYDSPGQPADLRMETERAPFIGVFTDDADFDLAAEPSANAESLYDGGGTVYLVIEVSVAGQMEDVPTRAEEEDADPIDPDFDRAVKDRGTLAATDAALEARIGFIARQAVDALCAPDNPWAELWRMLAPGRGKVSIRRGGSGQDPDQPAQAVRFASRIIRIDCQVLAEPVRGEPQPEGGFWRMFLEAAAHDADLAGLADVVSDHLEDANVENWLVQQRGMMATAKGVRGIGIGPATEESQETPTLKGLTIAEEREP